MSKEEGSGLLASIEIPKKNLDIYLKQLGPGQSRDTWEVMSYYFNLWPGTEMEPCHNPVTISS